MHEKHSDSFWGGIVKSMGMVFGDIGTSPIYTLTIVFALTKPTRDNVFGILSLVFWTVTILVTVQYAWLAMSLGRKGQGGEIVLREILIKLLKKGRLLAFTGFLSFLGVSLLLGDGVITPAISIMSAVEGLLLIPDFSSLSQGTLTFIAIVIAVGLFVMQYKGTDKVAGVFGPVMVVWFASLAVTGLASLVTMPDMALAISPHYAITFFLNNDFTAFIVLSEVILCATGGEALYADMGHLGRKPIIRAWYFVFFALIINYLGQGVFVLQNPQAKNLLFSMVQSQAPSLYIPFLLLTIMATVIASQALISGVFSIVYQGLTTRIMPLMKVDFTSRHMKSQIYIGFINWTLMCAVIFIMLLFQKSANLAAAYGLAVTGSMTITSLMMIIIFAQTNKKWKVPLTIAICCFNVLYLCSTLTKLPHGAYWSIILASFPFLTIMIWTRGQRKLYQSLKPLDLETFQISYEQIYKSGRTLAGTALFFAREWNIIPPYVIHCIIRSNIVYERNILISIVRTDDPFGVKTVHRKELATGLEALEVRAGYMVVLDLESILKMNGIREKVIFYGIEDINTANPIWKVFSVIKKLTPNFVQFNQLPASKLQGVVTRVEM